MYTRLVNSVIDSILRLVTVWRITMKIIRTVINVKYVQLGHFCVMCFIKVKLCILFLCVCAICLDRPSLK